MNNYPWYTYYGLSHAAITFIIMFIVVNLLGTKISIFLGLCSVFYWVWRETQGPDKNESLDKILFAYPDRIGDWLSPLVVWILYSTWILYA